MTMKEESDILKTDVLGRVTIPKAKREEMLNTFERSSMSGVQFARTHGIAVTTFASWIQKRRRARGDYDNVETRRKLRMPENTKTKEPSVSKQSVTLIEVEMNSTGSECSTSCLEIILANGVKILVTHENQIPLLKTLIREVSC